MIQVFFLGVPCPLSEYLEKCYLKINRDPEYLFEVCFSIVDKKNPAALPDNVPALLLYDLTEMKHEAAMTCVRQINRRNPRFQWVLLTDISIDYFQIAQTFQIGNILKNDQFDCEVIRAMTIRLMTGNIFGFNPYFPDGFIIGPIHETISGRTSIGAILEVFERNFLSKVDIAYTYRLKVYFFELLANTVAYAVMGISSENRDAGAYSVPSEFTIPHEKPFKISMVQDNEKYGVSIMDTSGTLSLSRVMAKFRRQTLIGEETTPPGVWDITGRGLALILKDNRLIINIVKNTVTEIIFLHYRQKHYNKFESIIIAEIET